MSFVFALDTGERVSPYLGEAALAIFETPHSTPYAFNLHVQDVGHTLVLGGIDVDVGELHVVFEVGPAVPPEPWE